MKNKLFERMMKIKFRLCYEILDMAEMEGKLDVEMSTCFNSLQGLALVERGDKIPVHIGYGTKGKQKPDFKGIVDGQITINEDFELIADVEVPEKIWKKYKEEGWKLSDWTYVKRRNKMYAEARFNTKLDRWEIYL